MPPKKRGRGRPRKILTEENVDNSTSKQNSHVDFENEDDINSEYDEGSGEEFDFDEENEYDHKILKSRKTSKNKRGRPSKKEKEQNNKLTKNKRKSQSEDVSDFEIDDSLKYKAGKFPAKSSNETYKQMCDNSIPLDDESELWRDRNKEPWDIPAFQLQVFDVIEKYIWKRGGDNNLQFFKDFVRWPSRKFYPDYYHKIVTEDCISLKDIQKRSYLINEENETDISTPSENSKSVLKCNYEQLILDLDRIYKNCSFYNEKDTIIVRAAYQLVNLIKFDLLKLKNQYRNFEINPYIKKEIENKIIKKLERVTEQEMFQTLENSFKPFEKPDRELDTLLNLIEPFLDLVDKEEFPDYYQLIYKPISFGMIKSNLKSGLYKTVYDFYLDIELLFFNCKTYNPSESLLHVDATHLLSYSRIIFDELITALEEKKKENSLNLYRPYEQRYLEYKKRLLSSNPNDNENMLLNSINMKDSEGKYNITGEDEIQGRLKDEQPIISALTNDQINLLQNGGKANKYVEYPGNIKFVESIKSEKFTNEDNNISAKVYDKNEEFLFQILKSNVAIEKNNETCFSNLKLTFFQDYRFADKNMTNINLNDFEKIYATSSKIKEVLQKDNSKIELYHFNLKNDNPSKSYNYSLKNPLSGNKNLFTHLELQLLDLNIEYKDTDFKPPYTYKCQVYFNNVIGGAPVIISPKSKTKDEQEKNNNTSMVCLYNIKLSQKRSFVSIVVTREKEDKIDLKETINLWFNV